MAWRQPPYWRNLQLVTFGSNLLLFLGVLARRCSRRSQALCHDAASPPPIIDTPDARCSANPKRRPHRDWITGLSACRTSFAAAAGLSFSIACIEATGSTAGTSVLTITLHGSIVLTLSSA